MHIQLMTLCYLGNLLVVKYTLGNLLIRHAMSFDAVFGGHLKRQKTFCCQSRIIAMARKDLCSHMFLLTESCALCNNTLIP